MDLDEALRLLRGGAEGIAEWNRWRGRDEPLPDLEGAHLGGAYLQAADLTGAHLRGAHLRGAHLEGADLRTANTTSYLNGTLPSFGRPFVLDDTRIQNTRFSAWSQDPWSILRRTYTGPKLVFTLV